ncbi:MAG: ABC transporter permease, partial [Candidatus Spyradocola sp.]
MFYNLAFKNVLRSFKDYSVYFLTLTFGVCIFYVFNSLDSQQVLLDFTKQQSTIVYFMLETIAIVSAIMAVVLAGLILYANNFILRRRRREFGLYMTLGIQRRRIALMLLVETLAVGVLSLAAGL